MSTREIVLHVILSILVAVFMFYGFTWADGGLIKTLAAVLGLVAVASVVINVRKLMIRRAGGRQ